MISSTTPFLETINGNITVRQPAPFDFYGMVNGSGELFKYNRNSRVVERMAESPSNTTQNGPIRRGERVYFGTEKGLIEVFDNGLRYFDEQQAPYVWSVAERPNGEVWCLNYGPPPQQFANGNISSLRNPPLTQLLVRERPNDSSRWHRYYYYHPAQDRNGTLYLPHELGLIRYDGKTARFLSDKTTKFLLKWYGGGLRIFMFYNRLTDDLVCTLYL